MEKQGYADRRCILSTALLACYDGIFSDCLRWSAVAAEQATAEVGFLS